jgi:cytochrome c1
MKICIGVLVILVVVAAGTGFYFLSGRYDVSATSPHWDSTLEMLEAVRDQSVKRHSQGINVPQSLSDPKLQQTGFQEYHETCRVCHGAPGFEPNKFAKGLYPDAPELNSEDVQTSWNNAQLYWITRNGYKMTGMPAFEKTYNEQETWDIVAFLRRLPDLKADGYRSLVESAAKNSAQ